LTNAETHRHKTQSQRQLCDVGRLSEMSSRVDGGVWKSRLRKTIARGESSGVQSTKCDYTFVHIDAGNEMPEICGEEATFCTLKMIQVAEESGEHCRHPICGMEEVLHIDRDVMTSTQGIWRAVLGSAYTRCMAAAKHSGQDCYLRLPEAERGPTSANRIGWAKQTNPYG